MRMKLGMMSLVVFGALGLPTAQAMAADKDAERIESQLKKDADLKDVRVRFDRVVTLTGKVASETDRARAERLATVAGVVRVDNQIEIADSKAKEKIDDRAEAAKERAQERADAEKNRIDRQAEARKERLEDKQKASKPTVQDELSNAWITTKLKSHYTTEAAFKDCSIHVDTDAGGTVTLTGVVASETAHLKALEVARASKGVRDVRDELRVAVAR